MSERLRMILAIAVMIVGVGAVAFPEHSTLAQDGTVVAFEVTWPAEGEDEDNCNRMRPTGPAPGQDRPAVFIGFHEVLTIRGADGEILHMQALAGELVEDESVNYCRLEVDASLSESAGYTIWHEDTYLASIPPEGLQGDFHLIMLSDS